MENAVDGSHVSPQSTNSLSSSSEDDDEENVCGKEQHGSSLVSMLSSELVQDGSCLAEQHLSTAEGNWFTDKHIT